MQNAYLKVLRARVPVTTWRKIIDRAVNDAMHGGAAERRDARQWLARVLLPTAQLEVQHHLPADELLEKLLAADPENESC